MIPGADPESTLAQAWRDSVGLNQSLAAQVQALRGQVATLTAHLRMSRDLQNRAGNRMPSLLAPLPLRPV